MQHPLFEKLDLNVQYDLCKKTFIKLFKQDDNIDILKEVGLDSVHDFTLSNAQFSVAFINPLGVQLITEISLFHKSKYLGYYKIIQNEKEIIEDDVLHFESPDDEVFD